MLARRLAASVQRRHEELTDRLAEISGLDAPSGGGDLLQAPAALLESWLAPIAERTGRHESPAGPIIEAQMGTASSASAAEALLLCHYDTVWPAGTAAARPFHVRDGIAYGPGVLDMRGGIIAAIGALQALHELDALARPVRILLTPDEESGSTASRELIAERCAGAAIALVAEPALPDGSLKTARKGWIVYRLTVTGRAAHAGLEPERGVSAVDELVDLLLQLRSIRDPAAGTTLNCGELAAGNPPNVIAERAQVTLDIRVPDAAAEAVVRERFATLEPQRAGANLTVGELHSRKPMERTPEIAAAAARAKALADLIGLDLGEGSAGGVSDANLAAAAGIPVLDGLGPSGGGAHAADEHVSLRSLMQRAALIALLLTELDG